MAETRTQAFIEALRRLEGEGGRDDLVALFAPGASLENPIVARPEEGEEGADRFWRVYGDSFESIRSEFHHVLSSDEAALLEWTSTGRLVGGRDISYSGVSLLEFDDDGRIRHFRAYFDPTELRTPAAR